MSIQANPDPNFFAFDLEPGGDFVLLPNGSIATVTGWNKYRQSILRALLTNPALKQASGANVPADYIFDPNYGVGISSQIDELESQGLLDWLQSQITQQVLVSEGVDTTQDPDIQFATDPTGTIYVQVTVYLTGGPPGQLVFSLNN